MGNGSRLVELWPSSPEGDWRTAFFYVPEGSSEEAVQKAKMFFGERWFTWLAKEGYEARPPVYFGGPYRSPDPDHLGDSMYLMHCRFTRWRPRLVKREVFETADMLTAKHAELPRNEPDGLLEYLTKMPRDEAEERIKKAAKGR